MLFKNKLNEELNFNKLAKLQKEVLSLLNKYDVKRPQVEFNEKYCGVRFDITYSCSEYAYTFNMYIGGKTDKLDNDGYYIILPQFNDFENRLNVNIDIFKSDRNDNIFDKVDSFKYALKEVEEMFEDYKKIVNSLQSILEPYGFSIEGV